MNPSSHAWRRAPGLLAALAFCLLGLATRGATPARRWSTTADLRLRLTEETPLAWTPSAPDDATRIEVHADRPFQTLLGLGSSLEPSTCSNLFRLPEPERARAIERLVHPERGIGMNLMRVCMGTPDFTGDPWYSYCDLPPGESDPELRRFSIDRDRDRTYILPVLRDARRANPELLFFASPWSPPGWMKSSGSMIGGHLLPERRRLAATGIRPSAP